MQDAWVPLYLICKFFQHNRNNIPFMHIVIYNYYNISRTTKYWCQINILLLIVKYSLFISVTMYKLLNCFSLIKNTNYILNTNVGKTDLTYLHGIRVLSLFWIILLHFMFEIMLLPGLMNKGEQFLLNTCRIGCLIYVSFV